MTNHTTKRCADCKLEFPATHEYFSTNNQRKDNLSSYCKSCIRIRATKIRRKKGIPKRQPKYLVSSELRRCTICENIFPSTTEFFCRHAGFPDNLDIWCKGCKRTIERERIRQNPERNRLKVREWQNNNPEKAKAAGRIATRNRRAKAKQTGGVVTKSDIEELYRSQNGLCWWCGKSVGDDYHVDHRIPLSRGGTNWSNNLCISCASCNLSKNNKMPWEWSGRLL